MNRREEKDWEVTTRSGEGWSEWGIVWYGRVGWFEFEGEILILVAVGMEWRVEKEENCLDSSREENRVWICQSQDACAEISDFRSSLVGAGQLRNRVTFVLYRHLTPEYGM